MRLLTSIIVFSLLLSSCATSHYRYQSEQNSAQWQGRSVSALQQQWGDASQTFHSRSGSTYYVYTTNASGNFFSSTVANFSINGSMDDFPVLNQTAANVGLQCVTVFKANQKGIITNITHQGNNCGGEWVPKSTN